MIKVKKWQIRHRRYIVNLPYENDQFLTRDNTSVLGMQFGWNQNNLIMVGFYKSIRTGTSIHTYIHHNTYCSAVYLGAKNRFLQCLAYLMYICTIYVCMYVCMHH